MDAILLPLNHHLTAYHVLLPLRGKEFSFAVHNVPLPKDAGKVSLQQAKLECGPELRLLLRGVERTVQERLNQSFDLPAFVLELTDMLERIAKTQSQSFAPTPEFYAHLCSNLDSMGWEHVDWLSPELTSVNLRIFDSTGREHIVHLDMPPNFPEEKPTASADLPISAALGHLEVSSFKEILALCQSAIEKYQDFWTVMEDIDRKVWILEPDHPSRATSYRRIALGSHCSLSIRVDPLSPRATPECRFFGSDAVTALLRKKLNSGFSRWDQNQLVVANLEGVLELTFPSTENAEQEDMSADCGICYAYRASEGTVDLVKGDQQGKGPDRVCNNARCSRLFHTSCLTDWLLSVSSTRRSFDVLFGHCPYCSHPIAVKSVSD